MKRKLKHKPNRRDAEAHREFKRGYMEAIAFFIHEGGHARRRLRSLIEILSQDYINAADPWHIEAIRKFQQKEKLRDAMRASKMK